VTAALKSGSTKFLSEAAVPSATLPAPASWLTNWSKKYPLDTIVQNYIVPTVRAPNQLRQGRAAAAVQRIEKMLTMELSGAEFAQMEPTYVRGMAYLQLHNDS
jgi:hypothetical protein